jgi:glyoxylase-like metal-dependent hydrolase (beta-lactamase superfamily II)
MAELHPGFHQIEQILGPRYLFQYLLLGERSMLIDTGIASSPDETILPYFDSIGFDPASLDYILISHADVDHFGGNARLRQVAPRAVLACHRLDAAWIGSRGRILAERYGWYKQFDLDYPPETAQFLESALGPDVRVDLHLSGDERFALSDDWTVRVLHLPGHSDGHIGLYDEKNQAVIVIDAILWRGLLDMNDVIISPPPYSLTQPYLEAIDRVLGLDFQHLYTGHYANKSGAEARQWLAESRAFVYDCHEAVAETLKQAKTALTLAEVHAAVDQKLGPFTAFAVELAKPVYAHLEELVAAGLAAREQAGAQPTWRARSS